MSSPTARCGASRFQSQMTAAVEGFGEHTLDAFLWGKWRGDSRVGNRNLERPLNLGVVGKLRRRRHLSAEEFSYLRARTRRTAKITLPSPSLWVNFWSRERSGHVYPTVESFLTEVVEILREEMEELVRLGATYIQIDAPQYGLLLDPRTRAFYERQAGSVKWWLERAIELDNAVMSAVPSHVTIGFHLCRGNQGSRWLAEGSYDPIAPMLFRKIKAHRLLLEYDDDRSGSFEPLGHVPEDKMVVLGLVTTKSSRLETREELSERIGQASPLCADGATGAQPTIAALLPRLLATASRRKTNSGNSCWLWKQPVGPGVNLLSSTRRLRTRIAVARVDVAVGGA